VHLSKGVFKEPNAQAAIIRADLVLWADAVQLGNSLWTDLRSLSASRWWFHATSLTWRDKAWVTTRLAVLRSREVATKLWGVTEQRDGVAIDSGPSPPQSSGGSANLEEALSNTPRTEDLFEPQYQELVTEVASHLDKVILPPVVENFGGNRERALRNMLVDFQSAIYLERASRFLYGSQIDALIFLGANNSRATREEIGRFYDAATVKNPNIYQSYSFERWLGFLQSQGLVSVEGDIIALRAGGKAIIGYMQRRGYLTWRAPG
jgi:hypothetical protein